MKVSEAKEYLEGLKQDQEIVQIVILQRELEEVTGPRYDKTERLANLLSRKPDDRNISWGANGTLRQNYWYEKREVFAGLVEAGVDYLEREEAKELIRTRNDELTDEMGLRYDLSVGAEIRPLRKVIHPKLLEKHPEIEHIVVTNPWKKEAFVLEPDANWADVLEGINEEFFPEGTLTDHRFLESVDSSIRGTKVLELSVSFGS